MNKINKSETKRRIGIMQGFLDDKILQIRDRLGCEPWSDYAANLEPEWDWSGCDYRIKPLEFPKLPEGMTYHNPLNMTPEQFGEGFRPLVEGELVPTCKYAEIWTASSTWERAYHANMKPGLCTYRVPSDYPFPEPPKPKVMVPLEPSDISPTDVLRKKDRKDFYAEHWMKIDAVNSDGPAVHFAGSGRIRIPFKTLMNEWEISRDGAKTWNPCEKES